jgi:hypothetical protein
MLTVRLYNNHNKQLNQNAIWDSANIVLWPLPWSQTSDMWHIRRICAADFPKTARFSFQNSLLLDLTTLTAECGFMHIFYCSNATEFYSKYPTLSLLTILYLRNFQNTMWLTPKIMFNAFQALSLSSKKLIFYLSFSTVIHTLLS